MVRRTSSVLVAAGALGAALGCAAPGSPVRALVVISGGIDPEIDQRLARDFAEELGEFGFRVVIDPEPLPADADAVALARERAQTVAAAHAVVLRPSAVQEREGVIPGTHLQAVRLEVSVVNEDPDHPVRSAAMEFASEDERAAAIEERVTDGWIAGHVPFVVDLLYQTPQIAAMQPTEVETADLEGLQRLRQLELMASARAERARAYEAFCRDEGEALAATAAAEGIRCFGDPCGQHTLLGVDPQDRAIVQDISRVPIFTIPLKDQYWWEPPERMLAIPLDRPDAPQTLLRSGNFYGFGAFHPGAAVGAVELFSSEGTTAVYAFDLADGARRALSHYAPGEESVFSRAAPDGAGVFACLDGPGCFYEGGDGRKPMRDFVRAELVTLPEGVRVFGQLQSGELALDVPGQLKGATVKLAGRVDTILGVHEGLLRLVTVDDEGACSLVRVTPAPLAVAGVDPMPVCIDRPVSMPDGRVLGTAAASGPGDVPGDDEVVTWAAGDPNVKAQTTGTDLDEYAFVTKDGRRAVFNRRFYTPSEFGVDIYRRVVCVADLD